MYKLESGLDVGGCGSGLVAFALITAVGVGGAGRVVTAGVDAAAVIVH